MRFGVTTSASSFSRRFFRTDRRCLHRRSGQCAAIAGRRRCPLPGTRRALYASAGHCRLINCYGPTENTTFTTFHPVRFADCVAGHTIPIGRPVSNTTVYVLDALQQPVPSGVVGEAYIGGDGVMKGYLGDPQFTREYIYPDPFSDERDAFLYRTGDLVRLRRDGELEFIGRMDDQVKIRGFESSLAKWKPCSVDAQR